MSILDHTYRVAQAREVDTRRARAQHSLLVATGAVLRHAEIWLITNEKTAHKSSLRRPRLLRLRPINRCMVLAAEAQLRTQLKAFTFSASHVRC